MSGTTPVWQERTGASNPPGFVALSESTGDDEPLVLADIAGSIGHTLGLLHVGLLSEPEAFELVDGLQQLAAQAKAGELELDPNLEDVHMNVEHALYGLVGEVAGKLHTGRSRNDQVALDLVLHTRAGLAGLASSLLDTATILSRQAQAHQDTPWVAKTHGQPAQPANLGLLLHAHAKRLTDLTHETLTLFEAVDESPLGSGAVAGSTLPLDAEYTADLLGLEPPSNALLATSSRDTVLRATQLCGNVGIAAASLATDLITLADAGQAELPDAYTTGSSIMPHKRNPDALELVRAYGKGLPAHASQLAAVLAGLGLGYHRDLQLTKPPLTQALWTATGVVEILAGVTDGTTFDPDALGEELGEPGVLATDALEALVLDGIAFREAYACLARAFAAVEQGTPIEQALAATELGAEHVEVALEALQGEPAARTTAGGPGTMPVQVDALHATQATLADAVAKAQQAAKTPTKLLDAPVKHLVAHAIQGGG